MENWNLQLLKRILKYLMIICLPILVFNILGIILKPFNLSNETIHILSTFAATILAINATLCAIKASTIDTAKKENRFKYTMIWYFSISIILTLINIYVVTSAFLDNPLVIIFDGLILCIIVLSLVWIWFFYSCYKECKVAISKDNKGRILFFTNLIRTILVAIASFLLIQTNIINNISSNSYSGMPLKCLLNCPDFQKDLFCAIAYFFNCIASLFYPMIDMYMYTVKATRKKAEDYEILD
ncbi:MAG: hypothetical protein M3Z94_05370 [Lactobacillus panisapium]|nr:hypothetical protein [Lactobacillus panisapium]